MLDNKNILYVVFCQVCRWLVYYEVGGYYAPEDEEKCMLEHIVLVLGGSGVGGTINPVCYNTLTSYKVVQANQEESPLRHWRLSFLDQRAAHHPTMTTTFNRVNVSH